MALSQSDLDRIDRAIASGQLSVEIDGTRIQYRSMNELLAARGTIQNIITAASGDSSEPSSTYAEFCGD